MTRCRLTIKAGIGFALLALAFAFVPGRNLPPPSQIVGAGTELRHSRTESALPETLEPPAFQLRAVDTGIAEKASDQPARTRSDRTAVAKFSDWIQDYLNADPHTKTSGRLVASGEKLAVDRRAILKGLIESDPGEALTLAVPDQIRRQLPEVIVRHLEQAVNGRGDFRVAVADNFERSVSEVHREATLGGTTYTAFVYGARLRQISQRNIFLQGIAIDHSLAVLDSIAQPTDRGMPASGGLNSLPGRWAGDTGGGSGYDGTAESSLTQGTKTLLFMPVAFSDDPAAPITQSAANQLMNQVNQWFTEQSYNSTAIIADVTPLLILPQPKAHYATQGVLVLQTAARAAALAAGFDTENYDLDIVNNQILGPPNLNFAGFGVVGGKGLVLQVPSFDVAVHELGHNYGLWHANFWSASGDSIVGPGSPVEYGNPFDEMGPRNSNPGIYSFNACFKNRLDWLPLSFVQTISNSGLYRVYAYDVPNLVGGQKYALRVQRDYARSYWAEFRQKFTGNPWTQNGVLLNWSPWSNYVGNSLGGTVLLDTTPGTPSGNSGKDDSPVVIGRTFSDDAAGIHITPVTKGTTGADTWIDVQVNVGAYSDNAAPTLQIAADQTSVSTNVAMNFSATATDPDGDTLAYYWDFGDLTFGTNSSSATKSWSSSGEYAVRCTVSDMKGGVASRNLVVTVGSPGTFRLTGRVITSGGQPVEGVRIHNGLTGAAYRGAYTDSDGYYALANLAEGSFTLSAVKYGYALATVGWTNPISVGPEVGSLDWTATPSPVLSIAASDPTAAESGANPGAFTLSRSGSVASALTVRFILSGTAAYSSDYTLSPTPTVGQTLQLVMPAGTASMNIALTPLGDLMAEGSETATITLFEHPVYVLGSFAEATVTIADSQMPAKPTVTVSALDDLITESGLDTGVFQFTRGGNRDGDLTVHYSVSGTAINAVDFSPLSGVVVIPAGQDSAAVSFIAIDDVEVEENEVVFVAVLPNASYNVGAPSSAAVTIVDDDPPKVTIIATDDTAVEGSSNTGTFTVTRVGNLAVNLVISYALGGTASNGVDYVALPGTVTIPAGQVTASFTVTPLNDSIVEGAETVQATIVSNPGYNIGNPGGATVALIDDDSPGITLTATDTSAAEAGPNTGMLTFTRTGNTANPLTVYFSISGSAINDADYLPTGNSLVIPSGLASAALTITPIDDAVKEGNETVAVTLTPSPTSSYSLTTTTSKIVTISDNDSGGLVGVGFSSASSSGSESQFLVEVSVSLSAPSSLPIFVDCNITGGTAVNGVDYATDLPSTLYFPAGALSQSVVIIGVNNNNTVQLNRTVTVALSNPVNAQLDAIANHTYTILDDDGAGGTITVTAINTGLSETGPNSGAFRISRSGATTSNLTVNFQVTGTASSPSDYLPIGNFAVIPAGQNHVDIVVTPVDDTTPEPPESVTLTLTSAANASLGMPNSATITIADNDNASSLPIVSVIATDPTASEAGSDTGTFTIGRVGNTTADLAVNYSVSGTATIGSDFASISNLITIPAGSSEVTIEIAPIPDAISEPDETVLLTLTVDGTYRAAPAASSATITISDNPPPVTVSFTASASSVNENSSPAVLNVSLSAPYPAPISVHYAPTGGTATGSGVDYTLTPDTLTFAPGETVKSIPITIINDLLIEPNETVLVTLDSPTGATLGTSTSTLTIVDGTLVTPYNTWVTANNLDNTPGKKSAFDADPEKDGLANGLEWILGGNPLAPSAAVLPQISADDTHLSVTFARNDDSESSTTLALQWGSTLTGWNDVPIGANNSGPDENGVSVTVNENGAAPDTVVVTIPRSNGVSGGLFVRVKASLP